MKAPANMTNEQLINWMDKTQMTLGNHIYSIKGEPSDTHMFRTWDLKDRWVHLQEELKARGIWLKYCTDRNLVDHDVCDACC